MTGFISSLLVEPLLRRARRLSPQPPSPSSETSPAESSPNSQQIVRPGNNDPKGIAVLTGGSQSELGQSGRYPVPANGSPAAPPSPPDSSHQRQDNEGPLQSDHIREEHRGGDALSQNQTRSPVPAVSIASRTRRSGRSGSARTLENSFEMGQIKGQLALPEDDGMGKLRQRIHVIRELDVGNAQKAQLIHTVMTESYYTSRGGLSGHLKPPETPPSDTQNLESSEAPTAHGEEPSNQFPVNQTSATPLTQPSNPYNLTREDLAPTYFPKVETDPPLGDGEDIETEVYEEACLGCEHYKRNVKLQCYTCKKWYTCRLCHDEVEDHHLNRRKTENMLCMLCGHAQPAAQWCEECDEQSAQYYCSVCKLWNNDSKKNIYHCSDCGICRIGQGLGKDFFHCKTCCVCLPISIESTHRCIERSTQCDCPICGDYMFTSPETVVVMRCGHSIHNKCLSEYSKSSYRCPICSKTITNMEYTFRNLDRAIESQPMPAEFKDTKALVYCNDCGAKSIVRYHWLGLRCDLCESYNTAQVRLLHGNVLDSLEEDNGARDIPAPRQRPSSYNVNEEGLAPTSAPLQINTNSAPGSGPYPRLSSPLSAEPNGQFASYSLSRERAVSPVISNYFGLPPDRGSERSKSTSLPGIGAPKDGPSDKDGEFHIWGSKLKYRYGFLDEEAESVDEMSEADGEEAYETTDGSEEEADDDDDDDDDYDSIEIFGHR